MKKIGLGISILLFALVLALSSTGTELAVLGVGIFGLAVSVAGFLDQNS